MDMRSAHRPIKGHPLLPAFAAPRLHVHYPALHHVREQDQRKGTRATLRGSESVGVLGLCLALLAVTVLILMAAITGPHSVPTGPVNEPWRSAVARGLLPSTAPHPHVVAPVPLPGSHAGLNLPDWRG